MGVTAGTTVVQVLAFVVCLLRDGDGNATDWNLPITRRQALGVRVTVTVEPDCKQGILS